MVSIVIDPSADLPDVVTARDLLHDAICVRTHVEGVQIDLASDQPPRHLVLQLLASAAESARSSKNTVVFGPKAAAFIGRMEFKEGAFA
jgi:hypothetical protein